MEESIEIQIFERISKAGRGVLFFNENFLSYGAPDAVRQALARLVKAGKLERMSTGIYVRPRLDSILGKVTPGIEDIARAIAKRDKARIVPTGIYSLNRLGLSTQVPLNVVYLTDGSARKIKIGKRNITFKRATPKTVSAVGKISCLAIQALRAIGKENVSKEELKKINDLLKKEEPARLAHDIRLAPAWIREIMKPVLKELKHE